MKTKISEAFLRILLWILQKIFGVPVLWILLETFGVPVESWGTGKAKNISDLLKELGEGECYLRIGKDGVQRVTEIVKMHITDPCSPGRGRLFVVSQTLPDGRVRTRNEMPAGKIKREENPDQAFVREMEEELRLSPSD